MNLLAQAILSSNTLLEEICLKSKDTEQTFLTANKTPKGIKITRVANGYGSSECINLGQKCLLKDELIRLLKKLS